MAKLLKAPKGKKPVGLMIGIEKVKPATAPSPVTGAPKGSGPPGITVQIHHHHYAPRIPAERVIERIGPNVIRDVRTPVAHPPQAPQPAPVDSGGPVTAGPVPAPMPRPQPSPMPQARPRPSAPGNGALRYSGNPNAFKFGRRT